MHNRIESERKVGADSQNREAVLTAFMSCFLPANQQTIRRGQTREYRVSHSCSPKCFDIHDS